MRVLGIMSGTSLDAADYAVCEISEQGQVSFEKQWQIGFPRTLRTRLNSAAAGQSSSHETGQLHHDLGRFYAFGAERAKKVRLVGLHGQTIFHQPGKPAPATLQIGEPAYTAAALRAPVFSNFRAADIALGGEGAPLATKFHVQVFAQRGMRVAVNNLGGISNVTSLDWRSSQLPKISAFDTGPANMLVDLAVAHFTNGRRKYDSGGQIAGSGRICNELLNQWLRHPFIRKSPPKSTGRELFGESFFQVALAGMKKRKLHEKDFIATLTEFTARSVALNYKLHLPALPDHVILCGGGALNPYLFARIAVALRELRSDIRISTSADHGWDPQVVEASAFAFLAWLSWHKQPGNVSSTTGAAKNCILGQLTWPP